jgi:hypothetical protein
MSDEVLAQRKRPMILSKRADQPSIYIGIFIEFEKNWGWARFRRLKSIANPSSSIFLRER